MRKPFLKIIIENNFHNSCVTLYAKPAESTESGAYYISKHQVKKARNQLCGISDCVCGDFLGARGPQSCSYDPLPDGSAVIYVEE